MINHTYLRNKIADLQEQINRQKAINQRLMNLIEQDDATNKNVRQVFVRFKDGTTKKMPITAIGDEPMNTLERGLLIGGKFVEGASIVPDSDLTTTQPDGEGEPSKDQPKPLPPGNGQKPKAPYPSDDPEDRRTQPGYGPQKEPSVPEGAQDGLGKQAGSGAAAMGTQLAQAGLGAGGNASGAGGGVNINMANMFAGQNAQGPVNVGGNQQVSSGAGNQTMNFGTMATGGGVAVGGSNSGNIATGRGSINTNSNNRTDTRTTTTTNTNSGNTTNTNSGNTTTNSNNRTNSGNTTTNSNNRTNNTNKTNNTNSGNTTTNTGNTTASGGSNVVGGNQTNTNAQNNQNNTRPKPKQKPQQFQGVPYAVTEEFNKKLSATSDELNRIFGRKDGGLRKS
jgi:hypothetical protein